MHGPIEKFKTHLGLNRKGYKKGKKKPRHHNIGSVFRDYRGVDGAVEDAETGRKK